MRTILFLFCLLVISCQTEAGKSANDAMLKAQHDNDSIQAAIAEQKKANETDIKCKEAELKLIQAGTTPEDAAARVDGIYSDCHCQDSLRASKQ